MKKVGLNKPQVAGSGSFKTPSAVPLTPQSKVNQWVTFTFKGEQLKGVIYNKDKNTDNPSFTIYVSDGGASGQLVKVSS